MARAVDATGAPAPGVCDILEVEESRRVEVYELSDLHVDFAENWQLVEGISSEFERHPDVFAVLLVAGDVSDDLAQVERTLTLFVSIFDLVFYCVGNHELWLKGRAQQQPPQRDSYAKDAEVLRICGRVGVRTRPAVVRDAIVVPLQAWWDDSLYFEVSDRESFTVEEIWADVQLTKFPTSRGSGSTSGPSQSGARTAERAAGAAGDRRPAAGAPAMAVGEVARHFCARNEPFIAWLRSREAGGRAADGWQNLPVVSFSHFAPRAELIPGWGGWQDSVQFNFSRVAGSAELGEQVRLLSPSVHCFGHLHRNCDLLAAGAGWDYERPVRFVSNCLGYPKERKPASDVSRQKLACVDETPEERRRIGACGFRGFLRVWPFGADEPGISREPYKRAPRRHVAAD